MINKKRSNVLTISFNLDTITIHHHDYTLPQKYQLLNEYLGGVREIIIQPEQLMSKEQDRILMF